VKKAALALLFLIFAGCGSNSTSQNAPVIANLQLTPQSAALNSNGGSVALTGTIDFADADANLSTITITSYDSQGNLVQTLTNPIQSVFGLSQGTISISTVSSTTQSGSFPFNILVTDSTGLSSNTLSGTFTITP
jgi:hypothetical protein